MLDGQNPTQLSGYGGFEVSRTPAYSGAVGRAWLERRTEESAGAEGGRHRTRRGGVYVVANIRGGGEYGPSWHRAALQENRHRAYEDFAAVARDLISRGVTSRERLGCVGGSNGGLLVGNMLTRYPELFGAVSCGVPLLDMRRYTKLSAGHSWIAEYGDPDVPEHWDFIRTFSPYHLLKDGVDYPETFIWTATSDDRVGPCRPARWPPACRPWASPTSGSTRPWRAGTPAPRTTGRRRRCRAAASTSSGGRWPAGLPDRAGTSRAPRPGCVRRPVPRAVLHCMAPSAYPWLASNSNWRRARAAEWASLLMKCGAQLHRGFKSPRLRVWPRSWTGAFCVPGDLPGLFGHPRRITSGRRTAWRRHGQPGWQDIPMTGNEAFDAIIVGGGHNGLAAAAYLSKAGQRVLVLEKLGHAGGAAVSAQAFDGVDARLSRYSYLVSLLPQQIIDDLGLRIRLARRRYSSYTPDPSHPGRGLLIDNGDAAATAASFAAIGAPAGRIRGLRRASTPAAASSPRPSGPP